MTRLKVLRCSCGSDHEIEVDGSARHYAHAQEIAAALWDAHENTNAKALAAVLVLRRVLAEHHAPPEWVGPVAGLYADLAEHTERLMGKQN